MSTTGAWRRASSGSSSPAGNHDNWDWLTRAFARHHRTIGSIGTPIPISRTVRVLPRDYRFRIGGRLFLSFGGAHSTHNYVEPGWQQGEQIRDYHVRWAAKGLDRAGQVDVLLTHETIGGTPVVDRILDTNPRGYSGETTRYFWSESRSVNSAPHECMFCDPAYQRRVLSRYDEMKVAALEDQFAS